MTVCLWVPMFAYVTSVNTYMHVREHVHVNIHA
jgi:hypothetical protein